MTAIWPRICRRRAVRTTARFNYLVFATFAILDPTLPPSTLDVMTKSAHVYRGAEVSNIMEEGLCGHNLCRPHGTLIGLDQTPLAFLFHCTGLSKSDCVMTLSINRHC
ncbi:hypothetical protein PAXRUDRAFT_276957 [Paxillus rubicundulus Ve08.2h10]|uniref:Uncharacterized protein n=1 Tax=Paxillus rubicundulus Ve08.2h10 TaxID=930991 RepID=A0A0D0E5W2_9AGAM|nr:hypothetical protein PAXRUDRAFT_276957 [Paxillus rubicundulus Ve08.2h10]